MIFSAILNFQPPQAAGKYQGLCAMKCPYCGQKKAKVDVEEIRSGAMIHSAVHCSNPQCSTYDPSLFAYHPDLHPEKHSLIQKGLDRFRRK